MAEWLTYERYGKQSFTRTADEPPMRNGWVPRPATEIEIADEVARRIERDTERKMKADFEARQDYQDARTIANILEWITPADHPLDRLTPAEWAELRRRLTA